jgi:UTP--glucose-1-phosphate uridylyltransferase
LGGAEPFAVLLPDDVIRERAGAHTYRRELRRMMETYRHLEFSYLLSVAAVPRAKMPRHGIAEVADAEVRPNVLPITRLTEKPSAADAILRSPQSLAVVGRYLLSPGVFEALRELKRAASRPLQLTAALEQLRRAGQNVYAFKLKAERQDVGELMGQASELFADP